MTDLAVGEQPALVVDDDDFMAGQRTAAGDECAGPAGHFARCRRCRHGDAAQLVAGPVDDIDARRAVEFAEGDGKRGFGHAVARQEGAAVEPGRRQRRGKGFEDFRPHHVAADAGNAPLGEIEAADIGD